jgi:type I restriction enzyme S subunit
MKTLPGGWKKYKIKDIGAVVTGNTPPKNEPENYDGDLPWIKPPDLDNGMFVSTSVDTISEFGRKKIRSLPKGSILVSCIGNIGKVAIAECELCTNQQINSIIPNREIVDSVFIYYAIKRIRPKLEEAASSFVVPLLNKTDFSNIELSFPPLPTQKKIAAVLEKAEKLREWRKEADGLTDWFLKSTFLEMFGDPIRNPKKWELVTLAKVGSLKRGKSKHRPRDAPELLGGPYPLIQTGDVVNSGGYIGKYDQTYSELGLNQSKMWPSGTLCITIAANIAKTGILTFDSCFPDSVVGFIPYNNTKTEYIQFWLSFLQKMLEETAPESAQKNINLEILSNLNIPFPPFDLQQKFASIVQRVEQVRQHQKESKQQIDHFFNVLMQRAFSGELEEK